MEAKNIAELFKELHDKYLRAEQLMAKGKDGVEPLDELLVQLNANYDELIKGVSALPAEQKIDNLSCSRSDCEKSKAEFDERVKSWFQCLKGKSPVLSTSSPSLSDSCSTKLGSLSSSVKSEKRRSKVRLKLAAVARDQEVQRVHETRYRARQRAEKVEEEMRQRIEKANIEATRKAEEARREAEEARREAEEARREAEEAMKEAEECAEASLREKQRELELAQAEAEAWEEEDEVRSLPNKPSIVEVASPTKNPLSLSDQYHVSGSGKATALRPNVLHSTETNLTRTRFIPIKPLCNETDVPLANTFVCHSAPVPVMPLFSPSSVSSAHAEQRPKPSLSNLQPARNLRENEPVPATCAREQGYPNLFEPNGNGNRYSGGPAPLIQCQPKSLRDWSRPPFEPKTNEHLLPKYTPEITRIPVNNPPAVGNSKSQEYCDRSLPQIELKKFDGDPMNYTSFIRSFDAYIGKRCYSDDYRRQFLMQALEPKVRARFEQYETMGPSDGFRLAWSQLYEDYGHPHIVSRCCEERLKAASKVKDFDADGLDKLSILLNKCCTCLEHSPGYSTLDSMDVMLTVCRKLPNELFSEWVKRSVQIEGRTGSRARFTDLTAFVREQSRLLDSMFGKALCSIFSKSSQEKKPSVYKRDRCMASTTTEPAKEQHAKIQPDRGPVRKNTSADRLCLCCGDRHELELCNDFEKMPHSKRREFVRNNRLCYKCLKANHISRDCRSSVKCMVRGCSGSMHHTLLHKHQEGVPNENGSPKQGEASTCGTVQSKDSFISSSTVYLNVVPVKVRFKDREVSTYAFLDQGSTKTFCENSLFDELQATGVPRRLTVHTITSPKVLDTVSVDLSVMPLDGNGDPILLHDVVAVQKIPVEPNVVPNAVMKRHKHLRNITLPQITGGSVQLLIGADVPEAFRIETIFKGNKTSPDLIRSPLGWSLFGRSVNPSSPGSSCCNFTTTENENPEDLEVAHVLFLRDESDLNPVTADEDIESLNVIKMLSAEDRRTYELMKDSVKLVDGHYELPLPWRHDYQELPNNYAMALKRLNGLKRRLAKDPETKQKYDEQMQTLLSKGYAEEVPSRELDTGHRVWYVPHHPVFNPNKPDKLRIVYDCAAVCQDVSINQVLMQGPDLVNNLVGVLTRFRKESIAIIADIEAMFYQVSVSPRDRDSLRFLWWPHGDLSKAPIPHRMRVHLFGATSSPSCASFCLRQAATQFGAEFDPHVATTIEENFYVDDLLCSVANSRDGISLIRDLRSLLSKAGFRLTKWLSNSEEVIESIPEEERSKSLQIPSLDSNLHQRVLGVNWNVYTDKFEFTVALPVKPRTRRGILSTMNSLFDPLGFVSPIVLEARMIYRTLCQQELDWDEPIPELEMKRWEKWLASLPRLGGISIPRNIGLHTGNARKCRLHYFADASKSAYGAVCYLRVLENDDSVRCILLMAKSHLSPKAETSIPRLELMAAVTAVKMDQMLTKELGLSLRPSIFWSDSSIVVQSLHNERKRFPLFVSRRLAFIAKHTCIDNWKHVPTKQNPADYASRGASADALLRTDLWFFGPEFLKQEPASWPAKFEKRELSPNEIKMFEKTPELNFAICQDTPAVDRLISYFSSFFRLKRATAVLLKFKDYLLFRKRGEQLPLNKRSICVSDLRVAEAELVKYEQRHYFSSWMTRLRPEKMNSIKKPWSSHINRLDPILVDGILRVGGRLEKAPIAYETRHPAILPHTSYLTELIVNHCHICAGHLGLRHTLSLLNQSFWIIKANAAVKRIISRCTHCRLRHSGPGQQLMAELPPSRLQLGTHPFSHTGVDFFGPLLVRYKRSEIKRYGCLFTCLTTRAVHLELASDLSTDGFINVLRRFFARRGPVTNIYSDNGSNFVGAERLLKESIQNWNQHKIETALQQKEIQWHFNPPTASHMGGAWERMIRSVRRILKSLSSERLLTDDQLHTLLLEAESILNSRPLIPVTTDVDNGTPLTPNHLLRLNPAGNFPPTVTDKRDCLVKQRWRHVQYLADQFWQRWSREYLRTIIARQKWHHRMRNFQPDDVVLLIDNNTPRSQWCLGRISNVHPDEHGIVRTVTVKTQNAELLRPIHKLCLVVPVEDDDIRSHEVEATRVRGAIDDGAVNDGGGVRGAIESQ